MLLAAAISELKHSLRAKRTLSDATAEAEEFVHDFLLVELRSLEAEFVRLREAGGRRFNYYVGLLVPSFAAYVALVASGTSDDFMLRLSGAGALGLLSLIGIVMYEYLIYRAIATDRIARSATRIRKRYVGMESSIESVVPWLVGREPTVWILRPWNSTMNRVVGVMVALQVGFGSGLLVLEATESPSYAWICVAVVAVGTASLLVLRESHRFREARRTLGRH